MHHISMLVHRVKRQNIYRNVTYILTLYNSASACRFSYTVDSRACLRVGNDVSEWFLVNVGLRRGCMMFPWLFNCIYGWCGSRSEC